MRIVRLTLLAGWRAVIDQWTWRSFMATLMVQQVVGPLLGFLVWRAVAPDTPGITQYFAALLIVQLCTVSYEDHTLAQAIHTGDISGTLLQPQPVMIPFLGTNLALRVWHVLFGAPFVVLVIAMAGLRPSPPDVLIVVPVVVAAGMLRFLVTTTLALCAFWTDQAASIVGLGNVLIGLAGGLAVPLFVLPDSYAAIGRASPFWPMLGMPAEILGGTLDGAELAGAVLSQLGWLTVAALLARLVWARGLRRYSAIGA